MDVSAMMSELDDHGFDDVSDTRQVAVINDVIWDCYGREAWPFLEAQISLTFSGSSGAPTNWPTATFRAALGLQWTTGSGSNQGMPLEYIRYDDFLKKYGSQTGATGSPKLFYFIASTLYVFPTPRSTDVVSMAYVLSPAAVTSATTEATLLLPKEFHRSVIVNGALYKLYAMEDDVDIAPFFKNEYESAMARMREFVWKKQYSNNDVIHPVDADDLGWDLLGWYE